MKTIEVAQGYKAIVDDDMYPVLSKYRWNILKQHGSIYVRRLEWSGVNKNVKSHMHHCVIGRPLNGLQVDHINGNPLDNRRENLRIVTPRQNASNRKERRLGQTDSKYVGVHKNKNKWTSQIRIKNKTINLGSFTNEIDAYKAYKNAVKVIEVERGQK
jgi:hypothetical protein